MTTHLRIRQTGSGDATLLLLHGLGAVSEVWQGFEAVAASRWPGRILAPDLPGHGGSAPLPHYSFGGLAAAIAHALPASPRLVVLGHSLGGAVALALASGWFGPRVEAVCAVGIKHGWTAEELARARAFSLKPNPVYATRAEAVERHLKLAGLVGLVAPEAVSDAAVTHGAAGWSTAFDPLGFAVGAPDMPGLLAAARARVLLASGERDAMSPPADLQRLQPGAVSLPGLGHNAHVEDPEAVWGLVERLGLV